MKQSTLKRSAGLALSAALVLTTMIPNFATTDSTASTTVASTNQTTIEKRAMGKHDRGNLFAKEVEAGTITQAQADAIKAAMEANRTSDTHKTSETIMAELVTAGTLTQAQVDAIAKSKPEAPNQENMKGNPFTKAVTAGTITQVQADAIKAAMDANRTSDTHKTMETIMAELVTAGTLTQAQVDALVKDMPAKPAKGEKPVNGEKPAKGEKPARTKNTVTPAVSQ